MLQLDRLHPNPANRPTDLLLAREAEEGGQQYGLLQRIEKEEGGLMACRVVPWRNGDVVHSVFERELALVNSKRAAPETACEPEVADDVAEG